MGELTITTNNQLRPFMYRDDVPADILASQFDHLDPEDGDYYDGFFKYRGWWYHQSDFMSVRGMTESPMCDWHGYHCDSFFSGVVVWLSADGETYKVGTFIS